MIKFKAAIKNRTVLLGGLVGGWMIICLIMLVVGVWRLGNINSELSKTQQNISSVKRDVETIQLKMSTIQSNALRIESKISKFQADVIRIKVNTDRMREGVGDVKKYASQIKDDTFFVRSNVLRIWLDLSSIKGDVVKPLGHREERLWELVNSIKKEISSTKTTIKNMDSFGVRIKR